MKPEGYTVEEITEGLPQLEPAAAPAAPAPAAPVVPLPASTGVAPDYDRALAYVRAVPPAVEGARNNELNALSYRLVERFELSEHEHLQLCLYWAGSCTPPLPDHEARRTIRSAWGGCYRKSAVGSKSTPSRYVPPTAPAPSVSPVPTEQPVSTCRSLADWLNDPEVLNPPPRIPTTFKALDHALAGGFVTGGLYLVVGLTGRGKSTVALNMARRMAGAGTRTLLVALEDTPPVAIRRLIAQEARQPLAAVDSFAKPGLDSRHIEAIKGAIERLRTLPLDIEGDLADVFGLERLIRAKAAAGTQAVIIDQSSWMNVPTMQTPYEEASEIARRMKVLARALKIVIVVLVQVNRAGAGAKASGQDIELYHIRESGRWEQDCDGALILQTIEDSSDPALLTLDLKKHRHGPRDLSCRLLFTMPQNLIEDDERCPESWRTEDARRQDDNTATKPEWTPERFAAEVISADWLNAAGIICFGAKAGINNHSAKNLLMACEALKLCVVRGGTGRVQKEFRKLVCEKVN